jgi:hypothetical protein
MDDIHEHDVVALLVDLPDSGLQRGDMGTVVHVFNRTDDHPAGLMIEFSDESGRTQAMVDVGDLSMIVKLRFRPASEAA